MRDSEKKKGRFATTEWSLILAAGDSKAPESREALASLCQTYWYPVYAHLRQLGEPPDRAQDLTQGFFTHLLEQRILGVAAPERGRFRSFLKAVLRHYLSHERRWERTQKRGGGQPPLALDHLLAESEYALEPADSQTPEKASEQRWARTLLERTLAQLRTHMQGGTDSDRYRRLEPLLTGKSGGRPYREIATDLGMSESAVKVMLHRMRRRFGELLRREVARTVNDPDDVDQEIRHLFEVLA